ncbi:MAG: NifB/NifX family molybdenum-iron cluster-binding protein [Fusobacteriota bacterium]
MKIAVISKGKDLSSEMDQRFGRGAGFLIVETKTMDSKWINNEGKNASGGAGPLAAKAVAESGAEAIILYKNLGPKAADTLKRFEVKTYLRGDATTVEEAINLFKENKLEEINGSNVEEHSGLK